jgi:hypothetical protein
MARPTNHCINSRPRPTPVPHAPLVPQATTDPAYKSEVQSFVSTWLATNNRISRNIAPEDEEQLVGVYYTPKGLAKAQPQGTLQHTANAAFLVMAAVGAGVYDSSKLMRHACWVRNQIGYMLVSS